MKTASLATEEAVFYFTFPFEKTIIFISVCPPLFPTFQWKADNQTFFTMAVMKVIEIMADSKKSWEDATASGIKKASKSLKNIRSAWVKDQSVKVDNGKVVSYRVTLKVCFEVG